MTKIYFKCTLCSDVVLNASLATEGNMPTLDYIPGSNFLGIVANQLYKKEGNTEDELAINYQLFHSGAVSFGDALIAKDGFQSYALPFSLFTDKLKRDLTQDDVWVHHFLQDDNRPKKEEQFIQLKQHRSGYFNADVAQNYFKEVAQTFTLKSAHDREKRRSADGKMFGFKSLRKGQTFIFYIQSEDGELLKKAKSALTDEKRIGKSKSAQFGQVKITEIPTPKTYESGSIQDNQLVIYAESNLCFLNEFGFGTFEPDLSLYGISGEINWKKSQIRTYSYSPWNTHRNTSNTQRDCIAKGSVLVVDLKENCQLNTIDLPHQIGEYQAEGLGRVLYNPSFLLANSEGKWQTKLKHYEAPNKAKTVVKKTSLGNLLANKKTKLEAEFAVGQAVIEFMNHNDNKYRLRGISTSQWGGIRALAVQESDPDKLKIKLWGVDATKKEGNRGFLMNGVAAERYWDKNKGKNRKLLLDAFIENRQHGCDFLAKLASEMAKFKQSQTSKNQPA